MKHFPGLVTIGYLLIFCCIGLINTSVIFESLLTAPRSQVFNPLKI